MKSRISAYTLIGAAALTLGSCGTSRVANNTKQDVVISKSDENPDPSFLILSDAQRGMITRNNDFALRLFQKTSGMDSRVMSPLSVTYLMSVLANGADGQTRQEILSTIGWGDSGKDAVSLQDVNDFCRMMMDKVAREDKAVTVDIANYVAVNNRLTVGEGFRKAVTDNYRAGVESLDFSSSKTLKHINDWCSKQTRGMIPSIIDNVSPQDVSYLLNAIYFNGTWTDPFDKQDTQLERFRGYTRDIKRVDMMHRNDSYFYAEGKGFKAVEIPYGNRSFSMTVLLPDEDKSIDEVLGGLSAEKLNMLRQDLEKCEVDLKLPRFTTELEQPLNEVIASLGAPSMFSSSANFSRLASGDFFVSKMLQKAKIEVSEEGTKAAAVTAAIMTMSALNPEGPRRVDFHADRPFLYLITEAQTGAILFIGQYTGDNL